MFEVFFITPLSASVLFGGHIETLLDTIFFTFNLSIIYYLFVQSESLDLILFNFVINSLDFYD